MKVVFDVEKQNFTIKEIALLLWQNMLLSMELEHIFFTRIIGNTEIRPNEYTKEYLTFKVCEYFNITYDQICTNTRKRQVLQVRQIAMYFCKELTREYLNEIGFYLGHKDHATVLHSHKTVCNLMDTDVIYRSHIKELERRIKYGQYKTN